jgi:hypothetical protein
MDVGKFLRRNRNVFRNSVGVAVNFGSLAGGTLAGPGGYLVGHAMPDKTGGNETASGTNSRVG